MDATKAAQLQIAADAAKAAADDAALTAAAANADDAADAADAETAALAAAKRAYDAAFANALKAGIREKRAHRLGFEAQQEAYNLAMALETVNATYATETHAARDTANNALDDADAAYRAAQRAARAALDAALTAARDKRDNGRRAAQWMHPANVKAVQAAETAFTNATVNGQNARTAYYAAKAAFDTAYETDAADERKPQ